MADTLPQVMRYRCTTISGDVRVVAQDLARVFPAAMRGCTAFSVSAAAPIEPRHAVALPAPAPTIIRNGLAADEVSWSAAPASPTAAPPELAALIDGACGRLRLDPGLVTAMMYVESRFRPQARSIKGALGLMQVMPATAARYGVSSPQTLLDPATNVAVGTRYLRDLHDLFEGRIELVVAAYNAGEGAVASHGNRVPPYPETQDYVRRVLALVQAGRSQRSTAWADRSR